MASPIIYLIRHGEKPPKEADGDDAPGLSAEGVARSQALVKVFGRGSQYDIGYILAEHPKEDGDQARPSLTVTPLSEALGPDVPFDTSIHRDNHKDVAAAAKAFPGPGNVLICWEHGELTKIAKSIGVDPAPDYPDKRYDVIWTVPAPYDTVVSETSEHVPGLDDKYANDP